MIINEGYSLAGALTGFVVGLTGVGGGALMTPLLLLVWGIAPVTAVATDLWFAAITKLVGAGVHHQSRQIDWKVAKTMWTGSLPIALLLSLLLMVGTQASLSDLRMPWLTQLIAVVVVLTACALLVGPQKLAQSLAGFFGQARLRPGAHTILVVMAGALLGLFVTLTSIGAGALGCVFLLMLYPQRMTPQRLVATDIVHAIPLTVVSGLGYLYAGHVDMAMLGSLLLGSLPAVVLGSLASRYLHGPALRKIVAVVLFASGLKIFLS
jgi:uncharacterized membrane protein YfcA